jgi:hypothetical protein
MNRYFVYFVCSFYCIPVLILVFDKTCHINERIIALIIFDITFAFVYLFVAPSMISKIR